MAGPPGFEPGTLPQVGFLAKSFRVASHGFEAPRGKSLNDTYTVSPMLYLIRTFFLGLTELRALAFRNPRHHQKCCADIFCQKSAPDEGAGVRSALRV